MLNKIWQECRVFFGRVKDRSQVDTKVFLISISFVVVSSMVIGFMISNVYYNSQFKVIYSLDKRQNDKEIIKLIDEADKYVYFAIYFFTKENIAEALIHAKKRGLIVCGITDRGASVESNEKIVAELKKAGINVEVQKHQEGIMHLKTLVTDKAYASGSYNWTASATVANDEILEIGKNNSIRKKYLKVIQQLLVNNQYASNNSTGQSQKLTNNSGEIKEYDFSEAMDHIGEEAKIKGKVMRVFTAKSGVTFLDFCEDFGNCPFSAVIFASDLKKFPNINKYEKEVTITGLIKSYNGKAEIILKSPEQIE